MLLTQAIASEAVLTKPAEDLLSLEGIDEKLAYTLAQHNILTRDDLAELSIDDVREITELNEDQAGKLIMAARAHWFTNEV